MANLGDSALDMIEPPGPQPPLPAASADIPPLSRLRPGGATTLRSDGLPSLATPQIEPLTPSVQPKLQGGERSEPGPVTTDLVAQAGFPQQEAGDWASLANWMVGGEAKRFTEIYGGQDWSGEMKAHPKDLGWSGGVGPDGKPTSAAGLFQDQQGTWHKISAAYLGGNQAMTPPNQVRGNLRYAADLYKQRTGRDLLGDWKAGKKDLIAATLKDQWTSLGGGGGGAAQDPEVARYRQVQSEEMGNLQRATDRFLELAGKEAPGSAEQHALLRRAVEQSERLSQKFEKIAEAPPKKQSPFEAANGFAPLLIALIGLGGRFTRQPTLGAMNALGSALGGLADANDNNYKNALDVWKTQTGFAQKAFEMQNQSIRDIMEDQRLTETERQNRLADAYRVWGMEKDLALTKTGQWKDLFDLQNKRIELQEKIRDSVSKRQLEDAQAELAKARAKSAEALASGLGLPGAAGSLLRTKVQKWTQDHATEADPSPTPPTAEVERMQKEAIAESKPRSQTQSMVEDQDVLAAKAEQLRKPPDQLTPIEKRDARLEHNYQKSFGVAAGRATGAPSSEERLRQAIVAHKTADKEAKGGDPTLTPAESEAAAKEAYKFRHEAGISGNEIVKLEDHADQYAYSMNKIADVEDLMARNKAIAGVGGKLSRPIEAVGDMLHLWNGTDRGMFEADISYLQAVGARLLQQSQARPLSAEEHRISTIIGGLSYGDTTQRTIDKLRAVHELYTLMRRQKLSQISPDRRGSWQPVPAIESSTAEDYWRNLKLTDEEQQRSSQFYQGQGAAATPAAGNAPAPTPGVGTVAAPNWSDFYVQ